MSDGDDPKVISIYTGKERRPHVDETSLAEKNADCIQVLEDALARARKGDIARVMMIFESEEDDVFTLWSCMNERDALYLATMLQNQATERMVSRMGPVWPIKEDDPAV